MESTVTGDGRIEKVRAAWRKTELARKGSVPAGPEYEIEHYIGNTMGTLDLRLGLLSGELGKYTTIEDLKQHVTAEVEAALNELNVLREAWFIMTPTSPQPK